LAAIRIAVALILLVQAFMLKGSALLFLGHNGLVQGDLASVMSPPYTPVVSWFVDLLAPLNLGESQIIFGILFLYIVSLILLGAGLWTRAAAGLTWFLHWTLLNSSSTSRYGVDLYLHIFLFYLIFMPSGDALSIDVLRKGKIDIPSWGARLGTRVLQIHLCLSYLVSAISKSKNIQWWNGELIFQALTHPSYSQFDFSWLAYHPWIPKVGGLTSLALEFGYFIFIWPKWSRRYWVMGMVGMHLSIALFLGLGLFGITMAALTLGLFGLPLEPNLVFENFVGKSAFEGAEVGSWRTT
jgi:hypothetical protein